MVVSDEIWSDIILGGHRHIPTQSVSEDARSRTVAVYAPSKTFNLAGLVGSYHIIYNPVLRDRVEKEASLSHYNSMNVLSMHALLGAYRPEGYEWVDELCQVLTANVDSPATLSPAALKAWRSPGPRAPTCCFWTAPAGAKPTAKALKRCSAPAGTWAWPGRTAVPSAVRATSA